MADIQPFHVMALLQRARVLEAQGRHIVHMEIGEPDFPSPEAVVRAGIAALEAGKTHYTPALGLPELRRAIASSYPPEAYPEPDHVVVTPGASGALQLIMAVLLNPGDEVLIADPAYPCNRHFIRLFEGEAKAVPVDASTGYQLNTDLIRQHWTPKTMAVMVASPSNPTGTVVPADDLKEMIATVTGLGGVLIVDEIYHGIIYDTELISVLAFSKDVFVINSFSKYYGMTGWRVGWLVSPPAYVGAIDRLAQNIFLATSTPAQYAALAAFGPGVEAELQDRVGIFRQRRDYLLSALIELGFKILVIPQGAFYIYADCSDLTDDSFQFATILLEQAGVAITPGLDFGAHQASQHVRFSYTTSIDELKVGVERVRLFLKRPGLS
ncbi:MAG TPA: aminotransferase class I/II-fold pyridoxal phosphate-dependent enzyme [Acidiferrobacteraceae bacterium]|nr:aminotransferase class I/II-fold pyridoxal phosphate-dependent enzyme [Acidiferrobacteraceae bacterium]